MTHLQRARPVLNLSAIARAAKIDKSDLNRHVKGGTLPDHMRRKIADVLTSYGVTLGPPAHPTTPPNPASPNPHPTVFDLLPPPALPVVAALDLTVLDDVSDVTETTDAHSAAAGRLFDTASWVRDPGDVLEAFDVLNARSGGTHAPTRGPRLVHRLAHEGQTASTCALTGERFETGQDVPCIAIHTNGLHGEECHDVHPILFAAGGCYVVAAGIQAAVAAIHEGDDERALEALTLVAGIDC